MTGTAADAAAAGQATAPPPQKLLLASAALGVFFAPLNATMVAVALPQIGESFSVGVGTVSWIIVGYFIVMAICQPIGGKLGDLLGRRRLIIGSYAGIALFSLGAALTPNLPFLIAMRAGQALTAAMILPNGMALIREWVPEKRRAAAFGIIGAAAGLAAGVGAPLGAAFVAVGGWRAMFWVSVPLAALGMALALRAVPRDMRSRGAFSFDVRGVVFLAMSLTTLSLGVTMYSQLEAWAIAVLGVVGAAVGLAFLRSQGRRADPLMDLRLLRNSTYAGAAVTAAVMSLVIQGVLLGIPLFIQKVQDRGAGDTGLVLTSMAVPVIFLAPVAGRMADRWGRRLPAILGSAALLGGLAPLLFIDADWSLAPVMGSLAVVGLGIALVLPATQTAAVESAPVEQGGMASGMYVTIRFIGSIVGVTLFAAFVGGRDLASERVTDGDLVPGFLMMFIAALLAVAAAGFIRARAPR